MENALRSNQAVHVYLVVFCLVLKVCCGNWHYMILMESGQVYSWGFNDYGQLGLGSKMDRQVLRVGHGGCDSPWNRRPLPEACNKKYNLLTMYMMMGVLK